MPRFPRKMKGVVVILAVLVPSPRLSYVILVFEVNDQLVFMPGFRGWKISGINEGKNQFCQRARAGNCFHPRLIIGRAVVHQGDAVSVETVKSHHGRHAGRSEHFHNHSPRNTGLKDRLRSHSMLIFPSHSPANDWSL